jgi:hypothetical protein
MVFPKDNDVDNRRAQFRLYRIEADQNFNAIYMQETSPFQSQSYVLMDSDDTRVMKKFSVVSNSF